MAVACFIVDFVVSFMISKQCAIIIARDHLSMSNITEDTADSITAVIIKE